MKRTLVVVVVLALVGGACALSGLAVAAAPAGGSWTVTFAGKGTWNLSESITNAPLCAIPNESTESSNFAWTVTWKNVVFGARPSAGTGAGHLLGAERESSSMPASLSQCTSKTTCSKGAVPFAADEGSDADQPSILKPVADGPHSYTLNLELRNSGTIGGSECTNLDSAEDMYIIGKELDTDPTVLGALATQAKVPAAELRTSKKIIVIVSKNPFTNFPVSPDCVTNQIAGVTCTHSQTWSGTVTLVRSS
jgi:hypothetical protein